MPDTIERASLCPTCHQSLATPALAFLHERFHGANMHALSESQSQTIASLMEAYAEQARAAERERVAGVLREYLDAEPSRYGLSIQTCTEEIAQRLGVELKGTP